MAYIERDFPIERLNLIAQKEAPVGGRKPIYNLHKWWARRLGSVFRMLILSTFSDDSFSETDLWQRYYSKNQLKNSDGKPPIILDPFMGGGTTIVEALRLGCKVIGIDLNPVAWFVTKKEIEPVDLDEFDKTFKQLKKTVACQIQQYYKTTCPSGHKADSMYIFWVNKVPCLACGQKVPLFSSFRIAANNGSHTVFCPECYYTFEVENYKSEAVCPECSKRFVPSDGYSGHGKYTCPFCGQKDDILAAVRTRDGPPNLEMFALEYYCKVCGRGYKRAEEWDLDLFHQARVAFEKRKEQLLYPKQSIPDGYNTKQAKNYNYNYFFQLFNERQLLCLSTLLEHIIRIEDANIKELFLLALSGTADYSNMFCKYNASYRNMQNLFAQHVYWPTTMPAENNVWGAEYGKGTFKQAYEKIRNAKSYCISPFEKSVDGVGNTSKHFTHDSVETYLVDTPEELKEGKGNALLRSQTAEDLSFLDDRSIDAVITDPPYCDNVMYSELADFFHTWLRLILKDRYLPFQPEYTPKSRELIKNNARQGGDSQKAENFFFRGLTRCFKESNRVLKDNGLMVFTFHHKEPWAWKGVLKSLRDAGFYIISVYPISSESPDRTLVGISYDVPFVCRKRFTEGRSVAWEDLKDEIYFKAEESVERIKTAGRSITDVDLFVIVMGRCLELYSKHWPNVMKGGQSVEVDEAIDDIEIIVDSLIKSYELKQLPVALDELTRLYLLYIAGKKSLTHDELNKRIQTGGGSMTELMQRGYVNRKEKALDVTKPKERLSFIEREIERQRQLPLIDTAHYLYALYEEGRPLQRYLGKWGREDLIQVMKFLYKKSGDKTYAKIAE